MLSFGGHEIDLDLVSASPGSRLGIPGNLDPMLLDFSSAEPVMFKTL